MRQNSGVLPHARTHAGERGQELLAHVPVPPVHRRNRAYAVVPQPQAQPRRARSARQNRRLLVTLCTLLTVGLSFSVVASQVSVAQNQDRIDHLNRQLTEQQARYDRLRYKVAELESPERVVAAAQDKLGMVEPANVNYVAPPEGVDASANADDLTNAPDWQNVKSKLAAK